MPLELKDKRKQEATMQIKDIEQQVHTMIILFEKEAQLWTKLKED
jgi:hypothetical protein